MALSMLILSVLFVPGSSTGKEAACDAGDPGSIPGSGRSPRERVGYPLQYSWVSLVAQAVKNSPAVQETWVQSLGWEDPLEKRTATHSSILAWKSPWTEEPGRLQSRGSQRVRHDWAAFNIYFFQYIFICCVVTVVAVAVVLSDSVLKNRSSTRRRASYFVLYCISNT